MRVRFGCLALLLLPLSAMAHHSVAGTFDSDSIIELQGEVTRIAWQNPHVHFTIRAADNTTYEVESTSLSNLRRWEISPGFMQVGDHIKIAANPSKRGTHDVYALNVLLPDGKEVLLGANLKPRWSDQTVHVSARALTTQGDGSRPELGIFRTWSSPSEAPMLFPENVDSKFDFGNYPLTAPASASVARFDPFTDSPTLNCAPKGMPTVMEEPYPMEFARDGDNIRLRLEEYDTVRTIYMEPNAPPAKPEPSRLGSSVGHWENNTLVVKTSGATWQYFDVVGIPQSAASTMVERFTLAADGSRLDYSITVTDPANFTKPVTLTKYWISVPGVQVSPYHCTATP
jgi:Family of unknown function (DUF6152)